MKKLAFSILILASAFSQMSFAGKTVDQKMNEKISSDVNTLNKCLSSADKSVCPTATEAKAIHLEMIEFYREGIANDTAIETRFELVTKSRKVYFGMMEKDYTGSTWGLTNN